MSLNSSVLTLASLFHASLKIRTFTCGHAKNIETQGYTHKMDLKLVSRTLILAIVSGSFALTAMAQWQWLDKDGRKVFSDRAPPGDIQEKNILKRPGGINQAAAAPASDGVTTAPPPAPASKASAPRLSGKDAQLEARKKQAEEEEEAKKKVEEEKMAKARADNCERAKRGLANVQSGVRLSVTNAKGEREFMDDNARAAETKRLQAISESDCKK